MNKINIHANFPGGNIKVEGVDDNKIKLSQELRDTDTWWFYWSFCVQNAQGGKYVFEFTNGEVVGPWGPAVSKDGINWFWNADNYDSKSFEYTFGEDDTKVFFCFSFPYQLSYFERFYNKIKDNKHLCRKELIISRKGRSVPILITGNSNAQKNIIFTCRHHACECSASYVLEGLIDFLLSQNNHDYLYHIVPFVDIDGVENGDQGKGRSPHDHNRDYINEPIYETTKAIMEYVKEIKPAVAIDFHSPDKWGGASDYSHFAKHFSPNKEEIEKLSSCLKKTTAQGNGIVHNVTNDEEMSENSWNKPNMTTFATFCEKMGAALSCTFEFTYFGIDKDLYTQENCRELGRNFGRALLSYFKEERQSDAYI